MFSYRQAFSFFVRSGIPDNMEALEIVRFIG